MAAAAVTQVKRSKWASILAVVTGLAPLIDRLNENSHLLPPAVSGALAFASLMLSIFGGQQARSAEKKLPIGAKR